MPVCAYARRRNEVNRMDNKVEKQHVIVCVTGQKTCERLIVAGAQRAEKLGAELMVLHVARPGANMMGNPSEAEALEFLFKKSTEHGGDMAVVRSDDVIGAIEKQARKHNAVMLVTGRAANYSGWDLLDELKLRLADIPFKIIHTGEGDHD